MCRSGGDSEGRRRRRRRRSVQSVSLLGLLAISRGAEVGISHWSFIKSKIEPLHYQISNSAA